MKDSALTNVVDEKLDVLKKFSSFLDFSFRLGRKSNEPSPKIIVDNDVVRKRNAEITETFDIFKPY